MKEKLLNYRFFYKFLGKITILVVVIIVVMQFILSPYRMTGNNMFPFVKDGDLCVFYRLEDCYINDVVLYRNAKGNMCVGRIIATGGQTVDFPKEGGYTINDYQPAEDNPYETYGTGTADVKEPETNISYPLELAEDEVFILNDYRSDTDDGRIFGATKKDAVVGKLLFLYRRRNF